MPISGFPDRERHRFCIKCHQWCEPGEGRETTLTHPSGFIPFDAMRDLAGVPPNARFVCDACSRRSRRRWRWMIVVLAAVVIVVVALKGLGIIS
jgi:hypothetical protein